MAHSARTLPGVSAPSSVVRSIIEIARSIAHALAVVLIDRVASVAARASAPTWSTPGSPCRKRRSEESEAVIAGESASAEGSRSPDRRGSGRGHRSTLPPQQASTPAACRRALARASVREATAASLEGGPVRILFTSTPGYGHVLPMLPLARAALLAGHQVRWATGADACRVVRAAGIDATEAGLTDAEVAPMRAEARRAAAGLAPEEVPMRVFPLLFGAARTGPMLAAVLPLARDWRPDLIVHENGELAAPLVGTLLGVPHAVHAFGGAIPAAILADGGEHVAALWSRHGLEMPLYAGCYQHLYLDICPPALQTVPMDHIRDVRAARPVTYDGEDVPELAAVLPEDDGRPLVYVTLGTVSNRVDLMSAVVQMVSGLGVRLLVTVGPGIDPAALGPQPAGVRVRAVGAAGPGAAALRCRGVPRGFGHAAGDRGTRAAPALPPAGGRPVPQRDGAGACPGGVGAAPGRGVAGGCRRRAAGRPGGRAAPRRSRPGARRDRGDWQHGGTESVSPTRSAREEKVLARIDRALATF